MSPTACRFLPLVALAMSLATWADHPVDCSQRPSSLSAEPAPARARRTLRQRRPRSASSSPNATAASDVTGHVTLARADPCAALHGKLAAYQRLHPKSLRLFVRPLDALHCSLSVRFNRARELGNLKTIILNFQNFYGLRQIAKSSPSPLHLPSRYDIVGRLIQIGRTPGWRTTEAFYGAVKNAIAGLNDGHTQLTTNCPPFVHTLALPLVGVVEGGRFVVRVAPREIMVHFRTYDAAQGAPFNFPVPKYVGAQVVNINGYNPGNFIRSWAAKNAGGFHDPGQRLNNALAAPAWRPDGTRSANPGTFALRSTNPGTNGVAFRLRRRGSKTVETVRVPWLSSVFATDLPGFLSKDTYYSSFCQRQSIPAALSHVENESAAEESATLGATLPAAAAASRGRNAGVHEHDAALGAEPEAGPKGTEVASGPEKSREFEYSKDNIHELLAAANLQQESAATHEVAGRAATLRRPPQVPGWFTVEDPEGAGNDTAWVPGASNQLLFPAGGTLISSKDYFYPVYKLRDGKTGVVAIHTFQTTGIKFDQPVTIQEAMFLLEEAIKSFDLVKKHASQVIIDLSRNGGGNALAGWWMVSLLKGTRNFPKPRTQMQDFKHFIAETRLVKALRDKDIGYFNWFGYANANEVPFDRRTSSQFFYPVSTKKFGSRAVPGRYSNSFKLALPSLTGFTGRQFAPVLGARRFLLFSDGTCFSTCGTFSFNLRRRFSVRLVTVGGNPGVRMAFSAGGGGFVTEDTESIILTFKGHPSLMHRPDAPQWFTQRMTMTMRFAYGAFEANTAPIEFTWMPGDRRIDYSLENLADPTLQYLQVAKFLNPKA